MRVLFYREFLNACSYYRCLLPSKYLNQNPDIQSITKEKINEEDIDNADIIIFQKKYSDVDFDLLKYAKKKGKKTVFEVDDDLFNVPLWNPFYGIIHRLQTRYRNFISQVDLITVTCRHLKKKLQKFNHNIQILPNCIDFTEIDKNNPLKPPILNKKLQKLSWKDLKPSLSNKIKIGWAGSPTHREDLKLITDALINLCRVNPNIVVFMILCSDKKLVTHIPENQLYFINAVPLQNYYALLKELRWDFGLAPLSDHVFNKSKSNLKLIEYMSLGIIPIASYIENYTKTLEGQFNNLLIRPNTTRNWFTKLVEIVHQDSSSLKSEIQNFAKKNFNISNSVSLWEATFKNLLESR